MSTTAVVAMIVIGGFIWGGFMGFLFRAVRRERGKRSASRRGVR